MAMKTIQTTKIERGWANGRIHQGMGYSSAPRGLVIHTTLLCKVPNDVTKQILVPLFTEGDQLYAVSNVGEERKVTRCDKCPEVLDLDWQERANCRDTEVDMVSPPFNDIDIIIETYCSSCPVMVECLEYGINTGDNMGIWGGVFFPYRSGERKALIESL